MHTALDCKACIAISEYALKKVNRPFINRREQRTTEAISLSSDRSSRKRTKPNSHVERTGASKPDLTLSSNDSDCLLSSGVPSATSQDASFQYDQDLTHSSNASDSLLSSGVRSATSQDASFQYDKDLTLSSNASDRLLSSGV
jgi:hypothetical protein